MKALSTSRKLERSEQLKMLLWPLPQQGEGEGEGLFEATDMDSKTPHLHPLFFSEGRGEKGQVGSGAKLGGHNVDGGDFALVKPAINQCWRE